MKSLIIVGSPPSETSFCIKLSEQLKHLRGVNGEVQLINIFDNQWHLSPYFHNNDEVVNKLKNLIDASDRVIFVHPLWWGGMPGALKNLIDLVLTPGYAFSYRSNSTRMFGLLPEGLMKGKSAEVWITGDTPGWLYRVIGMPFLRIWKYSVLVFCGFKTETLRYIGGLKNLSKEEKSIILESIV